MLKGGLKMCVQLLNGVLKNNEEMNVSNEAAEEEALKKKTKDKT